MHLSVLIKFIVPMFQTSQLELICTLIHNILAAEFGIVYTDDILGYLAHIQHTKFMIIN